MKRWGIWQKMIFQKNTPGILFSEKYEALQPEASQENKQEYLVQKHHRKKTRSNFMSNLYQNKFI